MHSSRVDLVVLRLQPQLLEYVVETKLEQAIKKIPREDGELFFNSPHSPLLLFYSFTEP